MAQRAPEKRTARRPSAGTRRRGVDQGERRDARGRGIQSRPQAPGVFGVRATGGRCTGLTNPAACRRGGWLIPTGPMPDQPRYYITTAIAYPNGPPHIGHAYEVIATDAIARFMRLDGYDVFFLTGTDEHGIKIAQTAARDGITPKQLVDRNSARFQEMAKLLNA